MTRRRVIVAVSLVAVVALCGCGPTPPQAPLPQAKKLDSALSAISSACGLSYQTTALAASTSPDLSSLEASATKAVHKLASVYALDPGWIYQGETVGTIVADSITALGDCGLSHAKAGLVQAQAAHRSDHPDGVR
jgi:pectin methylesterase-like acyl-CoA thioesterase